jgi:hypothetical protein
MKLLIVGPPNNAETNLRTNLLTNTALFAFFTYGDKIKLQEEIIALPGLEFLTIFFPCLDCRACLSN